VPTCIHYKRKQQQQHPTGIRYFQRHLRYVGYATSLPLRRLRHKPTVTSVTPQACRSVGYATSLPLGRLRHKRTGIQGYHSMSPCFTAPRRRPSATEGYVLRPAARPAT
jgi:hypothetical protein